jgi:hypothetical protein
MKGGNIHDCDSETTNNQQPTTKKQTRTDSKIEEKRCGDGSCRYLMIRHIAGHP